MGKRTQEQYNLPICCITYFGVYTLFCPDHLLDKDGNIDKAFALYTSNWSLDKIQSFKNYLDNSQIEPKYKVKFWVAVRRNYSDDERRGKIRKKPMNPYFKNLNGRIKIYILFKNQYNNTRKEDNRYPRSVSFSKYLDEYFRNTIVSKFIETPKKVSPNFPESWVELRAYISLYMSRKFGWI